jgi:hypothetical protein
MSKHTHKIKDGVTRTPLITGGELMCSGRVSRSCSTSGTRRVSLVTRDGSMRVCIKRKKTNDGNAKSKLIKNLQHYI